MIIFRNLNMKQSSQAQGQGQKVKPKARGYMYTGRQGKMSNPVRGCVLHGIVDQVQQDGAGPPGLQQGVLVGAEGQVPGDVHLLRPPGQGLPQEGGPAVRAEVIGVPGNHVRGAGNSAVPGPR